MNWNTGRKGTTRNGWKVEDHADDYVLYSKEDGNLAIVIALETEEKKASLYAEAVKADGMIEDTERVSLTWETALTVVGVNERDLERN